MKPIIALGIAAVAIIGGAVFLLRKWQYSTPTDKVTQKTMYEFTVKDIKGEDFPLDQFKGEVVLVVNTASKCGFTKQYEGLEKLYKDNESKGFTVIGFPANDFMGQEPGSNSEISEFCSTKFKVTFPMMSKITVKGENADPLFKFLIKSSGEAKDIEWNFAKFLIGKDGSVIARFSPKTEPDSAEIKAAIEKALS